MHTWLLGAAIVLSHLALGSVAAQPEPAAEAAEDLVLEDFESLGEGRGWAGFAPSDKHVTSGRVSALWKPEMTPLVEQPLQHQDWTEYDTLVFSCYSEQATGSVLLILLHSQNPETMEPLA